MIDVCTCYGCCGAVSARYAPVKTVLRGTHLERQCCGGGCCWLARVHFARRPSLSFDDRPDPTGKSTTACTGRHICEARMTVHVRTRERERKKEKERKKERENTATKQGCFGVILPTPLMSHLQLHRQKVCVCKFNIISVSIELLSTLYQSQ